MCNFLSALVFKNGDIFTDPEHTDSHSELIMDRELEDCDKDAHIRRWIRVEFSPPSLAEMIDPALYTLKIDESSQPGWFDADMEATVIKDLRARVKRMIVTKNKTILLGGCWIVGGNIEISRVMNARVVLACQKAKLNQVAGSSRITNVRGSAQVTNVGPNVTLTNIAQTVKIENDNRKKN